MSRRYASVLFLIATALVAVGAALGISYPTRPPPGWMPVDPNAAPGKAEAKAEGSGGEPVQLLLVGKTRRFAIVRGELVGEKTGGTKLLDVKRNDVVVNSERGRETLNLFPDVEKTPPRKPAGMGKKEQK
jgi:hypothetical protein